jgi:signal transduction histidine kinase
MKRAEVNVSLLLTILVMSVVPLAAAFFLLDHTLETSLNLGFNSQVVGALDAAASNLRTLGRVDSDRRESYRAQFEDLQRLKEVYGDPSLIRSSIKNSLKIYFGLGFVATIVLSVVAAVVLSRRISGRYRVMFEELMQQREKVRYLQEMSSWQELARMLAHEIKNPLTPIEVLVSSLSRSYLQKSAGEFRMQLAKTEGMINEELTHLKNTVNRFSEFARLPQVVTSEQDLPELLEQQLAVLANTLEDATIHFETAAKEVRVRVDPTLFRQVLANILRNGIEANPGQRVRFDIQLTVSDAHACITLMNDGVPIPQELTMRIFDPYVSTKTGKNNMGLGLAIVRKIMIEHGGDVTYLEQGGRPNFMITIPRLT